MAKVYIAFWSGTGNTGIMAEAIAEGVTAAGGTPEFVDVESVSADTLKDAKAFALGCPSMGAEQLEESAMEPFVEEVEAFASGKQTAAHCWSRRTPDNPVCLNHNDRPFSANLCIYSTIVFRYRQ